MLKWYQWLCAGFWYPQCVGMEMSPLWMPHYVIMPQWATFTVPHTFPGNPCESQISNTLQTVHPNSPLNIWNMTEAHLAEISPRIWSCGLPSRVLAAPHVKPGRSGLVPEILQINQSIYKFSAVRTNGRFCHYCLFKYISSEHHIKRNHPRIHKSPAIQLFVQQLVQAYQKSQQSSALLALCKGNPPVKAGYPSQRPVMQEVSPGLGVMKNSTGTFSNCSSDHDRERCAEVRVRMSRMRYSMISQSRMWMTGWNPRLNAGGIGGGRAGSGVTCVKIMNDMLMA